MNKIVLGNDKYEILKKDDKILFEFSCDYINKIKIVINKSTNLEVVFDNTDEAKYDISYEIKEKVKANVVEIKKNNKVKILSKYNICEKSILNIKKINDINSINERNIMNLDGEDSKINCILKTVSKNTEKYDFVINHNKPNTDSDIITNGVNISGNLSFYVTTYIPNGNNGCIANQNNRIINLSNNECSIKPNLLIDEYDVTANHSALLGSFKDEELFYMQRLGISKDIAYKLLIEGFLKSNINNNLSKYFKKYWR